MLPPVLPSRKFVFLAAAFLCASRLAVHAQTSTVDDQRQEHAKQNALLPHLDPATVSRLELMHLYGNQRVAPSFNLSNFKEPLLDRIMESPIPQLQQVLLWNKAAMDMTALDHTAPAGIAPPPSTFGEQLGPARTARAVAMVHLAIFEAINAIDRRYPSYHHLQSQIFSSTGLKPSEVDARTACMDLAIEEAAFQTLAVMYPNKQPVMTAMFQTSDIHQISAWMLHTYEPARARSMMAQGIAIGGAAAQAVLADRENDGSQIPDVTAPSLQPASPDPLRWNTDPLHPGKTALGSSWSNVRPFVLQGNDQFPLPDPPAPGTAAYKLDLLQSIALGGDPDAVASAVRAPTSTQRTPQQTFIGVFWAYDATALLCAPPRLYNEVVTSIATSERPVVEAIEMARLLAVTNIAMADASIAAWTGKYKYLRARPITLIRGTGGENALWTPLGAPQSNSIDVVNLTPAFPSYPSGHATFGGALFQAIADFYGVSLDDASTHFTFVSDEWNGINAGPDGVVRPLRPQRFTSLADAETQNGMSRVYLGIHFLADSTAGIEEGEKVGDYVSKHLFQ